MAGKSLMADGAVAVADDAVVAEGMKERSGVASVGIAAAVAEDKESTCAEKGAAQLVLHTFLCFVVDHVPKERLLMRESWTAEYRRWAGMYLAPSERKATPRDRGQLLGDLESTAVHCVKERMGEGCEIEEEGDVGYSQCWGVEIGVRDAEVEDPDWSGGKYAV
ncbi:hypothetical protein VTL71DRAFT_6765 [Oculimacula yallundae]|uniref:Uncharacterized protein n=1 Tax=Oculimacula yallundae TaxID=86028 RepID=A0ABR4BXU8_9HELO